MGKLTDDILELIIERKSNGERVPDLAKEYNISESHIYKKIRNSKNNVIDLSSFTEITMPIKSNITFTFDNHTITINTNDLKTFLGALNG